jgi:hypothetical protein
MSARDTYHDQCKAALVKDGWRITHDPLRLPWGGTNMYVDLGAEEVVAAEKEGRKIAVEIKSFVGASQVEDLQKALGQFVMYRNVMRRAYPGWDLYLAVPETTYLELMHQPDGRYIIDEEKLLLIVFDPTAEEIKQWIP